MRGVHFVVETYSAPLTSALTDHRLLEIVRCRYSSCDARAGNDLEFGRRRFPESDSGRPRFFGTSKRDSLPYASFYSSIFSVQCNDSGFEAMR